MPSIGESVTCAETGRVFTVAPDGCSFNYATSQAGEILSDIGVDIRERRELLDRSAPVVGYLSSDGKHFTGWKGNILGTVTRETESRTGFHRSTVTHIRVTDLQGLQWSGKGSGRGMFVRIRPIKGN